MSFRIPLVPKRLGPSRQAQQCIDMLTAVCVAPHYVQRSTNPWTGAPWPTPGRRRPIPVATIYLAGAAASASIRPNFALGFQDYGGNDFTDGDTQTYVAPGSAYGVGIGAGLLDSGKPWTLAVASSNPKVLAIAFLGTVNGVAPTLPDEWSVLAKSINEPSTGGFYSTPVSCFLVAGPALLPVLPNFQNEAVISFTFTAFAWDAVAGQVTAEAAMQSGLITQLDPNEHGLGLITLTGFDLTAKALAE